MKKEQIAQILDAQLESIKQDLNKRNQYLSIIVSTDEYGKLQLFAYQPSGIINFLTDKFPILRAYKQSFDKAGMQEIGSFYNSNLYEE